MACSLGNLSKEVPVAFFHLVFSLANSVLLANALIILAGFLLTFKSPALFSAYIPRNPKKGSNNFII